VPKIASKIKKHFENLLEGMEELTGLFDLPQRSAKMVEGRGRSREGIGRRREAPLASVRAEGRRKNGLVVG